MRRAAGFAPSNPCVPKLFNRLHVLCTHWIKARKTRKELYTSLCPANVSVWFYWIHFSGFRIGPNNKTLKVGWISGETHSDFYIQKAVWDLSLSLSVTLHIYCKGKCYQMGKITSRSGFPTRSHSSCWKDKSESEATRAGGYTDWNFDSIACQYFCPVRKIHILKQLHPTF